MKIYTQKDLTKGRHRRSLEWFRKRWPNREARREMDLEDALIMGMKLSDFAHRALYNGEQTTRAYLLGLRRGYRAGQSGGDT